MTDRRDDLLDEVVDAFRRMSVPAPPDPALLFPRPDAPRAMGETAGISRSRVSRRSLMRPIIGYGSAAAILILALGWLALGSTRSVALAEVIRAAEQHKLVRYKFLRLTAENPDESKAAASTVYVDLVRPRTRFEAAPEPADEGASLLHVTVHDRRTGETLDYTNISRRIVGNDGQVRTEVYPQFMTHSRPGGEAGDSSFSMTPTWGEALPFSGISEKTPFLDALHALQAREGTVSAKVRLDGREAVTFSAEEANAACIVWVDPQSKLPLRIEYVIRDAAPGGPGTRLICKDFEWDPAVTDIESLFRTEPPAPRGDEKGGRAGE